MLDLTGQAEGDSSVHLSQMRLAEWVLLIFVWLTEDHNERPCPYFILVYLTPEDELSSSKLQGWWLGLVVICAIRRLTTLFGIFPCSCRLLSLHHCWTDGWEDASARDFCARGSLRSKAGPFIERRGT